MGTRELFSHAITTLLTSTKNLIIMDGGIFALLLTTLSLSIKDNIIALFALSFMIILDNVFGIIVSVKYTEFSLKIFAKKNFIKVALYGCCILACMLLEKGANGTWFILSRVLISLAAGVELLSALANMTIVCPHFTFLKFFSRLLVNEIASKLHLEKHEVEIFLYNENQNRCRQKYENKKSKL